MKNNLILILGVLLILLIPAASLSAADDENKIRMGICQIVGDGSDGESLSGGISNRIFEELSGLSERRIGREEISAFLSIKKRDELNAKMIALEKLLKEKDLLLFSGENPENITRNIKTKSELIEASRLEIEELKTGLDDAGFDVEEDDFSLVTIEVAVPEDGNLFVMKPGSPLDTAAAYNLDLVVYGSIEELDEYSLLELKIWNNITKQVITGWANAVRYNEVQKDLQPGIDDLKTGILGREWAALIVESADNSMIYVDDVFRGIGRIENKEFAPGAHRILVRNSGFADVTKEILLEAGETGSYELFAERAVNRKLVFQTYPMGADLYIDSVWSGKTPIRVEIADFPAAVRLSKEGWENKEFFVERGSENILDINLKPGSADRKSWVEDNRNRFYASLGAFVMSIPLTAMCFGGIEQTALAYNSEYAANGTLNIEELNRLESINQGLYGAYLGSIGLNIFLFFDTIIQAVDYVGSVDYVSK